MVSLRALKISSILKSQAGFSLTEIMVGGGILAGVALAGAQMFKDQNSAQKKVSDEQKLTVFHQGLVKKMGTSGHCNAAFKANGLVGSSINAGQSFNRLAQCTGNCVETNESGTDHRAADVTYNTTSDLAKVGSFVDGDQVWRVDDIRFNSTTAKTQSGPMILKVTYEMNPKLTNGVSKKVTKDLVVNARFEGGVFQECLSAQESSINNLQNDFCKTLNYGEFTSAGDRMAVWNPVTQQCDIGITKDCRALGLAVDGIDSNGQVKCKKIVTPVVVPELQQNTTSLPCTGTQKAVITVHSSGSLRVVCQ